MLFSRLCLSRLLAIDQDTAAGWRLQPANDAQQRGLAAAAWTDDRDEFSVLDLYIDAQHGR